MYNDRVKNKNKMTKDRDTIIKKFQIGDLAKVSETHCAKLLKGSTGSKRKYHYAIVVGVTDSGNVQLLVQNINKMLWMHQDWVERA